MLFINTCKYYFYNNFIYNYNCNTSSLSVLYIVKTFVNIVELTMDTDVSETGVPNLNVVSLF